MIIEVQLEGRGAVRIEADYAISVKQTKRLIEHATDTLANAEANSKPPRPIGFGAGSTLDAERSEYAAVPEEQLTARSRAAVQCSASTAGTSGQG